MSAAPRSLSGLHPWRRLSLYARVVIVNTAVLAAAVAVLAVSPATVSFPLAAEQGTVLVMGVAVIAVSNAVLIRVNFRGLNSVVRRMGDLDVLQRPERLAETGGRDARTLIAGFNAMVDRLESERRSSTHRTLQALEGERRRIGRELHDEIGQRLTGTLLQLGDLAERIDAPLRSRVLAIQEQERATLEEIGALAWQLRPALLDDLGLISALQALTGTMHNGGPELSVEVPTSLERHCLDADAELAVYRVAQEALTNAVRHSGARHIRLSVHAEDAELVLVVSDDGRGLAPDADAGPGIRGMRERALLVGGRLDLSSGYSTGRGVRVEFTVPLRPSRREGRKR